MDGCAIMLIRKDSLLGLPVSAAHSIEQTLDLVRVRLANRESCIVSFINPHAFHLRLQDQAYANTLWHFDVVLPDGIGVSKASEWINQVKVQRQSFDETSLFHPVLNQIDMMEKSVCLIGSKPEIADRAGAKMCGTYKNISYLGSIDGYHSFDEIVDWVMKLSPDVVIIGMGAPLQESLLLRLKQGGFKGVGFTCGGFFDQFLLETRYYPAWIDKLELRWLYRLAKEPGRLWRRYLVEYRTFILDVLSTLAARILGKRRGDIHSWLAKRYARVEA